MSRKNSPTSKTLMKRRTNPLKTFIKIFLYNKKAFLAIHPGKWVHRNP
jgi:hypothetical protein